MGASLDLGAITDGVDLQSGALDPEQVFIQFLCSTDGQGGGYDPDAPPDDKVRPAHAALHGRIFRLDSGAPIPPLDYGCRCAIRYVAKEGSAAARVIDETTTATPEDSVIPAQREWLDANAKGWEEIAKAAAAATPQERLAEAYKVAKGLGYDREIARMAIQASPLPMRAAEPLGIGQLSGVGPAASRLATRWQAGDATAGAELAKKYPATYRRLQAEGWDGSPPPAPSLPPAAPTPQPPPSPAQAQLEAAQTELDQLAAAQAADIDTSPEALSRIYDDLLRATNEATTSNDLGVIKAARQALTNTRTSIDAAIARRTARITQALTAVEVPAAEQTAAAISAPPVRATDAVRAGIARFRSLVTRAALPDDRRVKVVAYRGRRAFARPQFDEVHLGLTSDANTTVHELGHILERDPAIRAAAEAFLQRRTAGETARPLREITGVRGFRRDEVAKKDGFIDPYVGKIYAGGLTEVISMGVEYMAKDPIAFRAKDPDHFRFIFLMLRGVLAP